MARAFAGRMGGPVAMTRGPAILALLLLPWLTTAPAVAETPAPNPTRGQDDGRFGIQLLEIPAARIDDSRARIYIIDHVNPGTTITRRIKVSTTSRHPQHVEVYPAAASISGQTFTFASGRQPNELSSWIFVDKDTFRLPPHGDATLNVTISVPKRATKGERYAMIWAQIASPDEGQGSRMIMVNRVGIRVYLDVGPGGDPPSDFDITKVVPGRTEHGQPHVLAEVVNTGDRALDLTGWLWLSNGPGSVRAGPFRVTKGATVKPDAHGRVAVALPRRLPDGPWTFRLKLQSGLVTRTTGGRLVFPDKQGSLGQAADLTSPLSTTATVTGALGILAISLLALFALRHFRGSKPSPWRST